jgi:hypothetical protein
MAVQAALVFEAFEIGGTLTRDKDDSTVLVAVFFPERGTCLAGSEHAPEVGIELLQEIVVRHLERGLGHALPTRRESR